LNWKSIGPRALLSIVLAAMLLFCKHPSPAKTLTNSDINGIKGGQNKGVPTYKGKDPAGVPSVPGATSGQGAVVVKKHLPYKEWEEEYSRYFKEHYQDSSLVLKPKIIVLHYSGTSNFTQLWWTFIKGGQYEGSPGHLSVHYAIDRDGTIYELMPPNRRARGTYGVNHVAISIDIIGNGENDILRNKNQMKVCFALVRWLSKTFKIPAENVYAHTEVARGKEVVKEYTDFFDRKNPDHYPPGSEGRGPGKAYMFKLRYYLNEKSSPP